MDAPIASQEWNIRPVGYFHCEATYPYDAARQAGCSQGNGGEVRLLAGANFEQAAAELAGFSRIWLVYWFHHNRSWKPRVMPPRGQHKVGVFATRAPYRPNPIGLSCVELVAVRGRTLEVGAHDLLDGTPILDIKPYLPYADSFPDAACGWLDDLAHEPWQVHMLPPAESRLDTLPAPLAHRMRAFLLQQLAEHPTDARRKRVCSIGGNLFEIAYRTWRIRFRLDGDTRVLHVETLYSGYRPEELAAPEDPHEDKDTHRDFLARWPQP